MIGNEKYTHEGLVAHEGKMDGATTLHIFVNHLGFSKRWFESQRTQKRMYVAERLRMQIDKVLLDDENARIVIISDFNDETDEQQRLPKH